MNTNTWEKFDKQVDLEALENDVKDASENKRDYPEINPGVYEVKVNKMELKESKKGDPMVAIQFKIVAGENKGDSIFYNQILIQGFQIHNSNELLRSLDTGLEIKFNSYSQYNNLLLDIAEKLESEKLEYELDYGKNKKGYSTFKINEVFTNA